jgi:hypothetical protein
VNELEDFYFDWLLRHIEPRGLKEEYVYVCSLLHNCDFLRRVGFDENRAADGVYLRKEFFEYEADPDAFDPDVVEEFGMAECTWLEMLVALCIRYDYTYDGSVFGRFLELTSNMGLDPLYKPMSYRSKRMEVFDQGFVNVATSRIDNNLFDRWGRGGLFPLTPGGDYKDQREVEIWRQYNTYRIERREGVQWTSTN